MKREQEMNGSRGSNAKRYFGWPFWTTLAVLVGLGVWWTLTLTPTPAGDYGALTEEAVTVRAEKPSKTAVERKRRENARVLEAEKLKQEEQEYRNDIRRRTALFQSNIDAAYERFVQQIPFADAQSSMEAAHAGAKFLASDDGLCGYQTMFSIAYKLTCDKIKETTTFENFVNPLFEQHVMVHILAASEVYQRKMIAFQNELECELMAYQADVALRGKQFQGFLSELTLVSPESLKKANERTTAFDSHVKEIATATVGATIGVMTEAVFLKSTILALKSFGQRVIAPCFAKIVGRLVASYMAGGTLVVVDGPLPIGDIIGGVIALGGSAWTAYEVYNLMEILPAEIETNLLACINEIDAELRKQSATQAKTLVTEMKNWSEEHTKGL